MRMPCKMEENIMWGEINLYCPNCEIELKTKWKAGILYHYCDECGYEVTNSYSIAVKLWEQYLEILDMIEQTKTITLISAFDEQRTKLHHNLIKFYEQENQDFDITLFNNLCHNINRVARLEDGIKYNSKILAKISFSNNQLKSAMQK